MVARFDPQLSQIATTLIPKMKSPLVIHAIHRHGDWQAAEYKYNSRSGLIVVHINEKGLFDRWYEYEPTTPIDFSIAGQAADSATTVIGLSTGTVIELNPAVNAVGIPAAVIAKLVLPYFAKQLSYPNCFFLKKLLSGVGFGAATWNLAILAGAAASIAAPVGVAALVFAYWYSSNNAAWYCAR